MVAVEQWYASSTFWSAAGVMVAVLAAVSAVWITIKVANPRRRLLYSMPLATPLLSTAQRRLIGNELEIRRGGELLSDPQVLEVRLTSRSSRDIPRTAFDGGQPMRLDVGAPIIEVLQVTSSPDTTRCPAWTVDGTAITVGPGLIKKNQAITFSLLVDGGHPALTCPYPALIDVDVREQEADERRWTWAKVSSMVSVAIGFAATVAVYFFIDGGESSLLVDDPPNSSSDGDSTSLRWLAIFPFAAFFSLAALTIGVLMLTASPSPVSRRRARQR